MTKSDRASNESGFQSPRAVPAFAMEHAETNTFASNTLVDERALQIEKTVQLNTPESDEKSHQKECNDSVPQAAKQEVDDEEAMLEAMIASKAPTSMKITKCPHTNRKHYAKNMCSSCYRNFGRNQYATKCGRNDRLLYSMGMCQTCYLADYHQRRTKIKRKLAAKRKQAQHKKSASAVIGEGQQGKKLELTAESSAPCEASCHQGPTALEVEEDSISTNQSQKEHKSEVAEFHSQ